MIYRVGIVGCGRIGCGFDDDPKRKMVSTHAGAYTRFKKTNLIALADIDDRKLLKYGKKFGVRSLYRNYKEMLSSEDLHIVSVCTWNSSHLEIIEKALKYNIKAFFCEKPIADTLTNGIKIVNLCKKKKVLLVVDHQRRFDPFHQKIRTFMHEGAIGNIQQVSFYYTTGIANTGSHMFDLLRFLLGDVDWVQAVYSESKSSHLKDPNIDGIIKFKNGTLCSVQSCNLEDYLIFEVDILGTKGRLRLTQSGFGLEFFEVRSSRYFSGYRELYRTVAPINKNLRREFMLNAVKHIVASLETGNQVISSGEDALAALELICAFHESARRDGRRFYLPLRESNVRIESK